MKQRVAMVQYSEFGKSYPAGCERRDIEAGMQVYVTKDAETPRQGLQQAKVVGIEIWNKQTPFKDQVLHKLEEVSLDIDQILRLGPINSELADVDLSGYAERPDQLVSEIPVSNPAPPGWIDQKPCLSRSEFERQLLLIGFNGHATAQSCWRGAYVASSATQTLYILTRKNGIQLRVFDEPNYFDWDGNRLRLTGGRIANLHYRQSDVNLHDYAFRFARHFIETGCIDEAALVSHGISWRETEEYKAFKAEYEKNRSRWGERYSNESLYSALGGDGEDMYLGDGIWVSPGDVFDDRGR